MISIEPIPGKGLGVRAQRDFSPGEVIITEEVLIHCSRLHEVEAREPTAEQARQIYQKFNRLSTVDKFRVLSLFCFGERSILNIFSTNSFTITSKYCGLFVNISRFNHACDPSFMRCNKGNGVVCVANRKIMKGEPKSSTALFKTCNFLLF